jgi:hypothetical protein
VPRGGGSAGLTPCRVVDERDANIRRRSHRSGADRGALRKGFDDVETPRRAARLLGDPSSGIPNETDLSGSRISDCGRSRIVDPRNASTHLPVAQDDVELGAPVSRARRGCAGRSAEGAFARRGRGNAVRPIIRTACHRGSVPGSPPSRVSTMSRPAASEGLRPDRGRALAARSTDRTTFTCFPAAMIATLRVWWGPGRVERPRRLTDTEDEPGTERRRSESRRPLRTTTLSASASGAAHELFRRRLVRTRR